MGAWGTTLYANDTACDIRGDYIDRLRRGKSNDEVTQELIYNNREIMGDVEEEPLFWFALADTQWNYGRLVPEVREKALWFLSQEEELKRWEESGEKQLNAWKATREKLQAKLLSSPPPEKKVSKYQIYKCKWQPGDVFAYRFSGDYSKEKGVFGQYIIFRKVSEDIEWPGHIVPVVHFYQWIGDDIPSLDEIKDIKLLPQKTRPTHYNYDPNKKKKNEYLFSLSNTSARIIPKDNLTFLGNIPGDDLFPYPGFACPDKRLFLGYSGAIWKFFEKNILDQYFAWNPVCNFP